MALIQSALIWVVYAVVLVLLFAIASVFVFVYQAPRERSISVTVVCIFTILSLLATVLLLPVDIALVSSTTSSKTGRRKDWATQDAVDNIRMTLKIVYYTLYSLDALLCLIVVPFTYFWYEEYDEVATEEQSQTLSSRFWGAMKYTIAFIFLTVILFLIGFFVPFAKDRKGAHYDLEYFKHLLTEQRKSSLQRWLYAGQLIDPSRWRTSLDLCFGPVDYHWHTPLRPIHCCRSRSSPYCLYQVRARHLCSDPFGQHRLGA